MCFIENCVLPKSISMYTKSHMSVVTKNYKKNIIKKCITTIGDEEGFNAQFDRLR